MQETSGSQQLYILMAALQKDIGIHYFALFLISLCFVDGHVLFVTQMLCTFRRMERIRQHVTVQNMFFLIK